MKKLLVCAAIFCMAVSRPAAASETEPDAQGARMVAAFESWAKDLKVKDATFAAMRGNTVIGVAVRGKGDPYQPGPIGDLSQTVTAMCVKRLVEKGKLTYEDQIGTKLKTYFEQYPPADAAAMNITISQLMTETSGMIHSPLTFRDQFDALDFSQPDLDRVLAISLAYNLGGTGWYYAPNPANLAALGLVIEKVTGKTYKQACTDLVLEPAGIVAPGFVPNWEISSAWGGWNLSAVDYAKFLNHFRPGSKLMKSKPNAWPIHQRGDDYWISMGAYWFDRGVERPHVEASSLWYWNDDARPERNANAYSTFGMYQGTLRWVVLTSPKPRGRKYYRELRNAMWRAAYPASAIAESQPDMDSLTALSGQTAEADD